MRLSELQQQVFDKAKTLLKAQPWYSGVCMDFFPSDETIKDIGIDEAVERVYDQTAYWDSGT